MDMGNIHFPSQGSASASIFDEMEDFCRNDFRFEDGRIFNSICSKPLNIATEAYLRTIDTNLGDNRIFPGMGQMEEVLMIMLGNLFGSNEACGSIISGGTEANLLALVAALNRHKPSRRDVVEIVAPYSVHFSIQKIAKVLGIRLILTGLNENYQANVAEIKQAITPNTIALIATAGTSELGAIDDIESIASLAREYDLYFHVDAASGGFLIPFANELGYLDRKFDFNVQGVDSLTVDPHKFGLSVIPSGCILFRNRELQDLLGFDSHFVGTHSHKTFTGTRPGAAVASTYAVIKYLGRSGFDKIISDFFYKRDYLIRQVKTLGYKLFIEPELTIVAIKMQNPLNVLQQLESSGWITSLSKRNDALRIVIHKHTTIEHIDGLLAQLELVRSFA